MKKNRRQREGKDDRPRMGTWRIWSRVLCFSLPRIPFLLLAILAVLGVSIVTGLLAWLIPAAEAFFGTVGVLGSLWAFTFINGYGSTTYRTAQLAMITRGITTGSLPPHVFAEGKAAVRARFESVTWGQLFMGGMQVGVMRFIKKRTWAEIRRQRGHTLWADVRARAVLFGGNLIPYIGFCTVSYQFAHPDVPMLRGVCDGLEVFFRSAGAMLRRIMAVFVLECLTVFGTAVFFLFLFMGLLGSDPEVMSLLGELGRLLYGEEMTILYAAAAVLTVPLVSLLHLFLQPLCAASILRRYLRADGVHPSRGVVFRIVPKAARRRMRGVTEAEISAADESDEPLTPEPSEDDGGSDDSDPPRQE